ncbi:MAG: DUF2330 domain-containing protein [Thermoanaerobaculia bacterium]
MQHRAAIHSLSVVAIAATTVGSSVAFADRGSIPFRPDVDIFEPKQRALIAWNGVEEILILSTDMRASAPTKVLEVLPLPAEPKVTKGDIEIFSRAVNIINSHRRAKNRGAVRKRNGGKLAAPAGRVTFHEKIGAHDLSVIHVESADGFVDWVNTFLKRQGVEAPEIPAPLRRAVDEYLADGFVWFVFDVVELGTSPNTQEAIQYRFESDGLYYPLRISRTEKGDTDIELLVLTPKLLSDFPGLPISRLNLKHKPVILSSAELRSLSKEVDLLLGSKPQMKLRIWKIHGRLDSFSADLIARPGRPHRRD